MDGVRDTAGLAKFQFEKLLFLQVSDVCVVLAGVPVDFLTAEFLLAESDVVVECRPGDVGKVGVALGPHCGNQVLELLPCLSKRDGALAWP